MSGTKYNKRNQISRKSGIRSEAKNNLSGGVHSTYLQVCCRSGFVGISGMIVGDEFFRVFEFRGG